MLSYILCIGFLDKLATLLGNVSAFLLWNLLAATLWFFPASFLGLCAANFPAILNVALLLADGQTGFFRFYTLLHGQCDTPSCTQYDTPAPLCMLSKVSDTNGTFPQAHHSTAPEAQPHRVAWLQTPLSPLSLSHRPLHLHNYICATLSIIVHVAVIHVLKFCHWLGHCVAFLLGDLPTLLLVDSFAGWHSGKSCQSE